MVAHLKRYCALFRGVVSIREFVLVQIDPECPCSSMDRALDYGSSGWEFDSLRARSSDPPLVRGIVCFSGPIWHAGCGGRMPGMSREPCHPDASSGGDRPHLPGLSRWHRQHIFGAAYLVHPIVDEGNFHLNGSSRVPRGLDRGQMPKRSMRAASSVRSETVMSRAFSAMACSCVPLAPAATALARASVTAVRTDSSKPM